MTSKQLAILNSLVTYAAENVPGGISEDEQEVAKIVGRWTLQNTKVVSLHEVTGFLASEPGDGPILATIVEYALNDL